MNIQNEIDFLEKNLDVLKSIVVSIDNTMSMLNNPDVISDADKIKLIHAAESSIIYFINHLPIGKSFNLFPETLANCDHKTWVKSLNNISKKYNCVSQDFKLLAKMIEDTGDLRLLNNIGRIISNFTQNHPILDILSNIQSSTRVE